MRREEIERRLRAHGLPTVFFGRPITTYLCLAMREFLRHALGPDPYLRHTRKAELCERLVTMYARHPNTCTRRWNRFIRDRPYLRLTSNVATRAREVRHHRGPYFPHRQDQPVRHPDRFAEQPAHDIRRPVFPVRADKHIPPQAPPHPAHNFPFVDGSDMFAAGLRPPFVPQALPSPVYGPALFHDPEMIGPDPQPAAPAPEMVHDELRTQNRVMELESVQDELPICQSCLEPHPATEFVLPPEGSPCADHQTSFCRRCFSAHIRARAQNSQLEEIPCPEANCNELLSYDQMLVHAPREVFHRYAERINYVAIDRLDGVIRCSNEDCDEPYDIVQLTSQCLNCMECATRTCVVCGNAWHPRRTCERNRQVLEAERLLAEGARNDQFEGENELSEQTMQRISRRCPNQLCNVPIERNEGCDHMTCGQCGHDFCWLCLRNWNVRFGHECDEATDIITINEDLATELDNESEHRF